MILNREKIDRFLLKAVRAYTYNTPISKGKHRAYQFALDHCKTIPEKLSAETKDGRKFAIRLDTGMSQTVYFLGEFEKTLTEMVVPLLREGDTCLDVGANFGWYTSLFRRYCGETADIHSFEPTPPTFAELKENINLVGNSSNITINNIALGEKRETIQINLFAGLSSGHASISDQGRDDATAYSCEVVTLDSYLAERSVGDVNFVKVDIEGSELMFLRGAQRLLEQKTPPIFLMEMALNQTKNFGYVPNDLIEFIRQRADYDFYRAVQDKKKLIKVEGFNKDDIGANVICFPRGAYPDRFAELKKNL